MLFSEKPRLESACPMSNSPCSSCCDFFLFSPSSPLVSSYSLSVVDVEADWVRISSRQARRAFRLARCLEEEVEAEDEGGQVEGDDDHSEDQEDKGNDDNDDSGSR